VIISDLYAFKYILKYILCSPRGGEELNLLELYPTYNFILV